MAAGLLRASFVPPKPQRALRTLTRYRKTQIAERQREANRLHKVLEDTGIKLDCVASNILGASGRAMLDALCSGTTDPDLLADLARGRLRAKLPQLREALEGRFASEHALLEIGEDLADLALRDPAARCPWRGLKHLVVCAHQDYAVRLDRRLNILCFRKARAERFLGQDVLSRFGGIHDRIAVQLVRQRHVDDRAARGLHAALLLAASRRVSGGAEGPQRILGQHQRLFHDPGVQHAQR